ncbi:MAG TPA: PGPGW domain-containing protein [Methylomirabilota bacterium]|jgi:tellurite resistance protein TerC|nr:PGPGW domain-containing protein [Methylomirabilota bacterium]
MRRQARRIVVATVGGVVLLVGVALIVLPGPAFLVFPAGLAILATEFAWARRLLERTRSRWKSSAVPTIRA